jgi:hypothetical protein
LHHIIKAKKNKLKGGSLNSNNLLNFSPIMLIHITLSRHLISLYVSRDEGWLHPTFAGVFLNEYVHSFSPNLNLGCQKIAGELEL